MLIYYFAVYVYPFPATIRDPKAEGASSDDRQCLGWFVAVGPIIFGFILGAFHAVYTEKGSFTEVFIYHCFFLFPYKLIVIDGHGHF